MRAHTHFVSMIHKDNPLYNTWTKQLSLHDALLQDLVAEKGSAAAYKKHLDSFCPLASVAT